MTRSLKDIEESLEQHSFIRVHRSFIIPLSKISGLRNKIIRIGNVEIPLGSSYEESFIKAFKK